MDNVLVALLLDAEITSKDCGSESVGELLCSHRAEKGAVQSRLRYRALLEDDLDKLGQASGYGSLSYGGENSRHIPFQSGHHTFGESEGLDVDLKMRRTRGGQDDGKLVDVGLLTSKVSPEAIVVEVLRAGGRMLFVPVPAPNSGLGKELILPR